VIDNHWDYIVVLLVVPRRLVEGMCLLLVIVALVLALALVVVNILKGYTD
jgi:hypothetical protein